jgi:hypothetical protein
MNHSLFKWDNSWHFEQTVYDKMHGHNIIISLNTANKMSRYTISLWPYKKYTNMVKFTTVKVRLTFKCLWYICNKHTNVLPFAKYPLKRVHQHWFVICLHFQVR